MHANFSHTVKLDPVRNDHLPTSLIFSERSKKYELRYFLHDIFLRKYGRKLKNNLPQVAQKFLGSGRRSGCNINNCSFFKYTDRRKQYSTIYGHSLYCPGKSAA